MCAVARADVPVPEPEGEVHVPPAQAASEARMDGAVPQGAQEGAELVLPGEMTGSITCKRFSAAMFHQRSGCQHSMQHACGMGREPQP